MNGRSRERRRVCRIGEHIDMPTPRLVTLILALFWGLAWAGPAQAQTAPIAQVKTLMGQAVLVRSGQETALMVGDQLFLEDTLRTGKDSALGISFEDNTIISLGSGSELALAGFAFEPSQGNLSFLARLLKGTMLYVSGLIAKLSPEDVKISTPVATVTVRGTRLLVRIE